MKANRTIQAVTGECGRKLVRVPLANNRGLAVVDARDMERISALGLSANWQANKGTPPNAAYVRARYRGTQNTVSIARFIAGAQAGQCVSYRDGNSFNLRRENLVVGRGKSRMNCTAEDIANELRSIDEPYGPTPKPTEATTASAAGSSLRIMEPIPSALQHIADNLSAEDRAELTAAMPALTFLETINQSVAISDECFVATYQGTPVAVFGMSIVEARGITHGVPWCLNTGFAPECRYEAHRAALGFIVRWRRWVDVLHNRVHRDNTRAIAWLQALGFDVDPPREGEAFRAFTMKGSNPNV
jgi:hypothetical protein